MSGRYCGTCGEMDYSEWGDVPCACAQQPPPPSAADYCAADGHPYHGDVDDDLGSCYCGAQAYPAGGTR